MTRPTNEQIIEAYRETGSVWAAGRKLGTTGQTVHDRLTQLRYPLVSRNWSTDEVEELRRLAGVCTIGEIAVRVGRPYNGVACKISELGIGTRYGNQRQRKPEHAPKYPPDLIAALIAELKIRSGSVRRFARDKGLDLETFVQAIQRDDRAFWSEYTKAHSSLSSKTCPDCEEEFYPLTKKQAYCTRRCAEEYRRDHGYFGGNRKHTTGLTEGICQLCLRSGGALSSHHVLGKENDPCGHALVALCPGCHQIIGRLAALAFVDTEGGWENLIHLVLARRLMEKNRAEKTEFVGTYACVDLKWLTLKQLEQSA